VKKILCLTVLVFLAVAIASAQDYPRAELFTGFTYTRANSASNVPAFSANGGGGQFGINANRWLGFVFDMGAVHNGNISDTHIDTTLTNFLFGPRFTVHRGRIRPYFNILFGGIHGSTSTSVSGIPVASQPIYPPGGTTPYPSNQPVTLRASASQTAFAMTTGGGLDIKISRHVSFRPIGLDYLMTRLQNFRTAQDNNQHNLRYTAGLNFTFGGEAPAPPAPPPPPPPMKACWDGSSVPMDGTCPRRSMDLGLGRQAELCPGGQTTLSLTTAPQNATYEWTVNGQAISQGASFEFGTTGRDPGSYRVGVKVSAPDYNEATATTTIVVRPYGPPTGTLEVTPREIWAGEKAAISANFAPGQCGGALGQTVLTASEGSIAGNQFDSTEVRFDPGAAGEQRKTVTIVARVSDEKGSGTAEGQVIVKSKLGARRLPDIVFPANSARVNNCGKRVLLEELKAVIESDPAGKVVLVGHVSENEAGKPGLDQQRALNAAAVLSAGQGICYNFNASQILVGAVGTADNGVDYQSHFCGTTAELPGSAVHESEAEAKVRRVEVWYVPGNGALPASLRDVKDAASLSVSGLGCPR